MCLTCYYTYIYYIHICTCWELYTPVRAIWRRWLFLELDLDFLVGLSSFGSCWYNVGCWWITRWVRDSDSGDYCDDWYESVRIWFLQWDLRVWYGLIANICVTPWLGLDLEGSCFRRGTFRNSIQSMGRHISLNEMAYVLLELQWSLTLICCIIVFGMWICLRTWGLGLGGVYIYRWQPRDLVGDMGSDRPSYDIDYAI